MSSRSTSVLAGRRVLCTRASFLSAGRRAGSGIIAVLDKPETRTLDPASKTTLSFDATFFQPSGWWGSHELQVGAYLQPRLRNTRTTYYSNGGFALEEVALLDPNNPAGGVVPFHRRYYSVPKITTFELRARDNAVYIQDSWRPSTRLTVNAGIRLDWIRGRDAFFDLETLSDLAIGPRLGVIYALTKDGKNLLRASYGRVGDVPNANYVGNAGTAAAGIRDEYDTDLNGTFETVFATPGSTAVSQNRRVDPDRRWPWVDEYLVGYRRQLPGQLTFDVSFIDRQYKHRPAVVEVNGIYDGGVFRGYRDESQNDIGLVTNNRWNWFVYRGIEFDVTKRTKTIQLIANYTRAWQHLAGTWQPNDPASFIQPEAFANNRGIGSAARQRHQQPERHGRYAQPDVGAGSAPPGPRVSRAVEPRVRDQPVGAVWSVLRSGGHEARGARSTLRSADCHAEQRTRGVQSTGHHDSLRACEPRRRADQGAICERREPARRPDLQLRQTQAGRVVRPFNLFNADTDQQFFDGGNQQYSSNYAIKDGEFFGVNRQAPRQGQVAMRFAF